MNAPNAIIKTSVASVAAVPRVRPNPARLRKPSPLPLRPLVPDRFKPPKGEKQVFLPNFTLTFLRTPTQPPHFASFLTPLWLNKLDLKDYLYHVYGVQALRVRSFIIQGKVLRNDRTGRLARAGAAKKMTVEMVQGQEGQGPFVWPEVPDEVLAEGREAQDARDKAVEEQKMRQQPDERYKLDPRDAKGLKERARLLLQGKVRWRPSWEENGGAAAVAMGREG
ncbi:hypothetical protein HO173_005608 [Letharia columbiana]|uniref:Large ribosomal subunit protein uL23m n=1 Tax=Letharia columbiana TaxID=112416 RepID=A0A8H6FW92_9LECA|nr:uncharacterized protein HO173_005608 [Letharia columbiana]KAF6235980.1 hypothetical protein HO173_005608 [Letharia columbiana]